MTRVYEMFVQEDDPTVRWIREGNSKRIPDELPPEGLTLKIGVHALLAQIDVVQANPPLIRIELPPFEEDD